MKNYKKQLLCLIFGSLASQPQLFAGTAVLIEEGVSTSKQSPQVSSSPRSTRNESKNGSYLRSEMQFADVFTGGNYESIQAMRADRRVAVGVETFGRLGIVGLGVDLHFSPNESGSVGIGGGAGYQTFALGYKHLFNARAVAPYIGFGLARWSGSGNSRFEGSTPSYFEEKFLSDNEKATGQFGKNFFVPSFGVQIAKLEGRSAGALLFAEVVLMVETSTMAQVPTGAFGTQYAF